MQHRWDLTPKEAVALQRELAERLEFKDYVKNPRTVAGVDVGFEERGTVTRAAAVLLDAKTQEPIDQQIVRQATRFPYVPGLLSFRECPAILQALEKLKATPELVLCDGQGLAHPRRLGVAAHIGLLTGLPTIGVAKSRLCGEHREPAAARGSRARLRLDGEVVGWVLRSREGCKPIYVSPGHRVSVDSAPDLVMRFVTRYKLPEPTRLADRLASRR